MKQCTTCGEIKDESHFHNNARWADGLQKYCKACHKEINKKHYTDNKQAYIERARVSRVALTEWWKQYKETLKCQCCGESRWWCLDFHHKDPSTKDMAVSSMISNSKSKEAILEEIAKCVVVCRNCHADIHYKERNNISVV